MITPSKLNKILIIAIDIAGVAFVISITRFISVVNGKIKIEKMMVVKILNVIEKWESFLASLLLEKKVIRASKLVPIFAPNIKGIAWIGVIIEEVANICKSATNRLEDCKAIVISVPIKILKKKLSVARFI